VVSRATGFMGLVGLARQKSLQKKVTIGSKVAPSIKESSLKSQFSIKSSEKKLKAPHFVHHPNEEES